jgi:branched-chain amino acid aminotransferase
VPTEALLYICCAPVGPYYPSGFKPSILLAENKISRAAPGSAGNFKLGANYGPTIMTSKEAGIKGFDQVLWLFEGMVGEVGTSNIFFYWLNKDNEGKFIVSIMKEEIVTPPSNELILHGVTRDSAIKLI